MKRIIIMTIIAIADFVRLFKGEQVMNFLVRIGGVNDISLLNLMNVTLIALLSFFKRVRLKPCVGCNVPKHKV